MDKYDVIIICKECGVLFKPKWIYKYTIAECRCPVCHTECNEFDYKYILDPKFELVT